MKENLIVQLQAPFSAEEINFRITNTNKEKTKGMAVAYVNNSAIQNRLDKVFSPFGWQCSFKDWKNGNAQICTISVYDEEKKMWISKEDGAENTDFSSIKGGLSDSMKRCARMFGIGRYLASETVLKNSWVAIDQYKKIQANDIQRLKSEYNQFLGIRKAAIGPTDSTPITDKNTSDNSSKNNSYSNNGQTQIKARNENNVNRNSNVEQKHTLPKAMIDVINGLLLSTNTNRASMLEAYRVKDLAELTLEQGNDALKRLATKK